MPNLLLRSGNKSLSLFDDFYGYGPLLKFVRTLKSSFLVGFRYTSTRYECKILKKTLYQFECSYHAQAASVPNFSGLLNFTFTGWAFSKVFFSCSVTMQPKRRVSANATRIMYSAMKIYATAQDRDFCYSSVSMNVLSGFFCSNNLFLIPLKLFCATINVVFLHVCRMSRSVQNGCSLEVRNRGTRSLDRLKVK